MGNFRIFCKQVQIFVYGREIIEAMHTDTMLSALRDGNPRLLQSFTTPRSGISAWDLQRKFERLIDDRLVKITGDNVIITSRGIMHLDKGGYKAEIKQHKKTNISFWLSIISILVSISVALYGFLGRQA